MWRVDMYGQALGEQEWLPLSPKVVGLPDEPFDRESVSSEGVSSGGRHIKAPFI